jgi:catechol 2,3-dioxygenase-like lactoylglutathione lyase family enzyme
MVMELTLKHSVAGRVRCVLGGCDRPITPSNVVHETGDTRMRLGNFSISLAVKNLQASRAFYENLGFRAIMGDPKQNWLILQNGTTTIGLFQGMFEKNSLTFNPGWNAKGERLPDYDDVRDIQRTLKSKGVSPVTSADESTDGPASLMLVDPDGNPILIDQHVPRPGK